jgi:hypothetical protein
MNAIHTISRDYTRIKNIRYYSLVTFGILTQYDPDYGNSSVRQKSVVEIEFS